MSTYRQALNAAREACDKLHEAEDGAKKLDTYRLEAGALIRAAYVAGEGEGKTKAQVAAELGYSLSWVRELANADTPEKIKTARTKATKRERKRRHRVTKTKKPPSRDGGQDDPDTEPVETAFDTEAAKERPENYTTAFMIRLEQAMAFARDGEFLTAGMVKFSKNPDATRAEVASHCRAVVNAWEALAQKVEGSSYGKKAA